MISHLSKKGIYIFRGFFWFSLVLFIIKEVNKKVVLYIAIGFMGLYSFFWNFNWKNQGGFLTKKIKDDPNYKGVHHEFAPFNLIKGNIDFSERPSKKAIDIRRDYLEAYVMSENLYSLTRRDEEALPYY